MISSVGKKVLLFFLKNCFTHKGNLIIRKKTLFLNKKIVLSGAIISMTLQLGTYSLLASIMMASMAGGTYRA